MAPLGLNFRTIWSERWASGLLVLHPQYPLSRIGVDLKPRLVVCVDEKSLALPGMTSRFVGRPTCILLTTPTNHVVYIFTTVHKDCIFWSTRQQDKQLMYNVTLGAFVQPLMKWKSNEYYILWVCVCILRYPAWKVHATYWHLLSVRLYHIFQH